jgi:L-2,4-diaminobutyrate decarboxylase
LFADMVDLTFDLGRTFYEKLSAAPDFEPLHEPECNIVAFRYVPDELRNAPPERIGKFQLDLRREIIRSHPTVARKWFRPSQTEETRT